MKKKILLLMSVLFLMTGCSITIDTGSGSSDEKKETEANVEITTHNTPVATASPAEEKTLANNGSRGEAPNYSFNYAIASSQLANQGKYNYDPSNVLDRNVQTAWVEGISGTGEGEWIEIQSNYYERIHKIGICNGYRQNDTVYAQNGKLQSALLEFSDGSSYIANFDTVDADGFTYFNIGEKETSFVRVTLLSCSAGSKYTDTCISEIRVY